MNKEEELEYLSKIKRPKRCVCWSKKIHQFWLKFRCENCYKIYSKELTQEEQNKKINDWKILTDAIYNIYNL